MNFEGARVALTTVMANQWPLAHPTYSLFIEGQADPDLTQQVVPFVIFCLEPLRNKQLALDEVPPTRTTGVMEFVLFVRQGDGTKPFADMTDTITGLFCSRTVSGIRCMSSDSRKRLSAIGWQSRIIRVNFSFDSID